MSELTKQELHNLAMNIVGEDLKKKKFEILAVNSNLSTNPQFIVQDSLGELNFVVVRNVVFPDDPDKYDSVWMESFKVHAVSKKAKLLFAGVGFANSENMDKPVSKESAYIVKYNGLKEI